MKLVRMNAPSLSVIGQPEAHKQQGSTLVMAIFIMVVLVLLGNSLLQILASSDEGVAQEVIGTRALAAANSGMQAQLQQLFPLNGAALSCPASTSYNGFTSVTGLYNCSATVTCDNYATIDGTNYYRLESTGTCGFGDLATNDAAVLSSRTVQVEAKELE